MGKLLYKGDMMNTNRLESLKEEKDLKSKDMAKELNVNESTYSEWEHNKIPIPTRRMIQMANYFKVNIDYMLNLSSMRKTINTNDDIDLELIGNRLKEIRQDLDLTLRELGEKLNCSFSSLGSYERGEILINCDTLINICNLSKYSIDWVLGRSNIKKRK